MDVLDDLARVTAATSPAQCALPTPSAGLDVLALRRHLTGGLLYFEAAFGDPGGANDGADPHAYAGPDDLEALSRGCRRPCGPPWTPVSRRPS
ncbi:hypothetical protein [Actinoplanes italicus]|uniref:hypothetical protein n=1 Tax=Actinoplanes italicus TaxID=113567 RepID=UPI001943CBF2|nr:hypothetical protein [Actinoplanes italicus]